MNILVLLRMVPDVVEELEIAPGGMALDTDLLRMIVGESDDHALEEALLLKERYGGKVTVLALDAPEVDDVLYTALAKGVDRAMKVTMDEAGETTVEAASAFIGVIAEHADLRSADLILTGVQAINDLDGLLAPLIAYELERPYLGIITGLTADPSSKFVTAVKEFPAGVRGEFTVDLPAVFGIQAAERPPRYVPVAKVRAAMKSMKIEPVPAPAAAGPPLVTVCEMTKPRAGEHAEMLEGDPDEVSGRLCGILTGSGLL